MGTMRLECTFNSDGTCDASISTEAMDEGSWSLNGTTVTIDASGSFTVDDETVDVSVSLTCTYDDSDASATLTAKSGTFTMGDYSMDVPANSMTLTKQ